MPTCGPVRKEQRTRAGVPGWRGGAPLPPGRPVAWKRRSAPGGGSNDSGASPGFPLPPGSWAPGVSPGHGNGSEPTQVIRESRRCPGSAQSRVEPEEAVQCLGVWVSRSPESRRLGLSPPHCPHLAPASHPRPRPAARLPHRPGSGELLGPSRGSHGQR